MERTPNLNLPYIMASQAQKHVTHNEAIRGLDAIVHPGAESRQVLVPPSNPTDGVRYIIPVDTDAEAAWGGSSNTIAVWQDGAWAYYQPRQGWTAHIADENVLLVYNDNEWQPLADFQRDPTVEIWGINATADTNNRLTLSAPASLFTAENDDHRLSINKSDIPDTASILLQTGYSTRFELGLTGDDDFKIRSSTDGINFEDAMVIDQTTGNVRLPRTVTAKLGGNSVGSEQIASGTVYPLTQFNVTTDTLFDSTFSAGILTIGSVDAGMWSLEFQSNIAGPPALKGVYIRRNGAALAIMQFDAMNGANVLKAVTTAQLEAGDRIDFSIYQSTGANQVPGGATRFFAYRVGN